MDRFDMTYSLPSIDYWLGTDATGSSVLETLLKSTTYTLLDIIAASTLAVVIALPFAAASASNSSFASRLLFRVATTFSFATPLIAVLLLMYSIYGDSPLIFPLVAGFLLWGNSALTLQTAISFEWNALYIIAARSTGLADPFLIRHHLIPNLIVPIKAAWTANLPIMLSTSVLTAYLGANTNNLRLGGLLKTGYDLFPSVWWMWLPATVVVIAAFILLFAATAWLPDYSKN